MSQAWPPVPSDTGWINVTTFTNGWAAAAGFTVRHRRINGIVYLEGRITGPTTGAAFTLPPGFRPGQTMPYYSATLLVSAAGVVTASAGVNDLNVVVFIAA